MKQQSKTKTIYIAETYYHCTAPNIYQYEAETLGETGARVRLRGTTKFIPISGDRKFFDDKDKLFQWVRKFMERERELAEGVIKKLSVYLNDETNNEMIPLIKIMRPDAPPPIVLKLDDNKEFLLS